MFGLIKLDSLKRDHTTIHKIATKIFYFSSSRALSANAPGELHILRVDGHAFGVDRAEIGILEQAHEVSLCCLLQGQQGQGLESELGPEARRHLTHEPPERGLAQEKLGGFLVPTDLTQRHRARAITVRLLTGCDWRGLACCFRGQRTPRGLASHVLARRLLGAGHG